VLAVAETEAQAAASSEAYAASQEDLALVEALRAGDEGAFVALVGRYGAVMLRVARLYVSSRAVAEEVVQETWLGVLTGIGRFEGRASFKTWLFRILTNTAKTRSQREGRSVPFSSLVTAELETGEPSVDPDRFLPHGERWASHWASTPRRFDELPEGRLLSAETFGVAQRAIEQLPEAQRAVITMRDVAGFSSEDVCDALELSEGNQRVLLHRARAKVRRALEQYFEDEEAT
jgi:RNA polymerase sigma-70 factor (ECF subfamily)